MKFTIQFISFFVIQGEGGDAKGDANSSKSYRHYQTLGEVDYEGSALLQFLDGEFARIAKRKVEHNPRAEQVPTKIGRFATEPGFSLESNPNAKPDEFSAPPPPASLRPLF